MFEVDQTRGKIGFLLKFSALSEFRNVACCTYRENKWKDMQKEAN